jgi:hypothetical protein
MSTRLSLFSLVASVIAAAANLLKDVEELKQDKRQADAWGEEVDERLAKLEKAVSGKYEPSAQEPAPPIFTPSGNTPAPAKPDTPKYEPSAQTPASKS